MEQTKKTVIANRLMTLFGQYCDWAGGEDFEWQHGLTDEWFTGANAVPVMGLIKDFGKFLQDDDLYSDEEVAEYDAARV